MDKGWVHNTVTGERIVFTTLPEETGGESFGFDFYAAPSGGGVPMEHFHARQAEVFQMVRGELEVIVEGEVQTLRPGQELVVPPGTVHSIRNPTDREAYCKVEYRPAGENHVWFQLIHPATQQLGREPSLLEMAPFLSQGVEVWPKGVPLPVGRWVIAVVGWLGRLLRKDRVIREAAAAYYASRPSLAELEPPEAAGDR